MDELVAETPQSLTARLTSADLITDRALTEHDPDQLEHAPIAGRVADLIASAEPPVNIALFGSWGSGKSSFAQLLKRELKQQTVATRLVTYDAWTFREESFQRNFISQAATKLGFKRDTQEGHPFHTGLYEDVRSARVNFTNDQLQRAGLTFLGVAAAILFVLALFVGAQAVLTGENFIELLVGALPAWITATGVVSVGAAVIKEVLSGARLDVEQSAPSQELLRDRFCDLVDKARDKHGADRIVFFIDELDRCSSEQVVQVLSAVKHFLDQEACIFIVAADRQVVERALDNLPQATPFNPETPYYSSASEFIDKIFQHQVALPPLRTSSLNRFTHDLVREREHGIWAEVRGADPGGRLLDDLLHVLIPSHVRSPRRVKVLLNNFATNARIAQARGLEWLARAPEIAKLTALQTEFPLFAADLYREPRLPVFLFADAKKLKVSLPIKAMIEHHRLPPDAAAMDDEGLTPTDRPLVDEEEEKAITNAQRRDLRRYLGRTREYSDPSTDLLFLESVGRAVDLEDPSFGDEILRSAIDEPAAVIKAAGSQSPPEQAKAVRLLGTMIADTVGRERANVTSALLGIAALLDFRVEPYEADVVSGLRTHALEEGFDPNHLPLVLPVALSAGDADLTKRVLSDARLWSTPTQVGQVTAISDRLLDEQRSDAFGRAAGAFANSSDPLTIPVARLPAPTAEELLDDQRVIAAIESRLAGAATDAEALKLADELVEAAMTREDASAVVLGTVLFDLLEGGTRGYAAAKAHITDLEALESTHGLRELIVVDAIEKAPEITDAAQWIALLPERGDDSDYQPSGQRVVSALTRIFTDWEAGSGLADVVGRLVGIMPPGETDLEPLKASLEGVIGSAAWWTPAAVDAHREVHRAALALDGIGEAASGMGSIAVLADLERALTQPPKADQFELILETAELAGPKLADNTKLAESLAAVDAPDPLDIPLHQTRIAIAADARKRGLDPHRPPFVVTVEQLKRIRAENGWGASYAAWLGLDPGIQEVLESVLPIASSASDSVRNMVAEWASRQSAEDRSTLILGIIEKSGFAYRWIEHIARQEVDEPAITDALVRKAQEETNAGQRSLPIRAVVSLQPGHPEAQRRVADLVIWLIDQDTKSDWRNALAVLPALGERHGSKTRLAKAFKQALDKRRELTRPAVESLRRSGIDLPKKKLSDRLLKIFRRVGEDS